VRPEGRGIGRDDATHAAARRSRALTTTRPTAFAPPPHVRAASDGWVVASSCPRCGAPLDFAEGSNAVRCVHCTSTLLVTGRGRVLSYVVRPRVSAAEAAKAASFARAAAAAPLTRNRIAGPRLVFVPYYRWCAEEVRWRRERTERRAEPPDAGAGDLGEQLMRIVRGRERAGDEYDLTLVSRSIEHSFLARDVGGLASWSLGVRSGVLPLELLDRDALEAQGTVLRPTLAADAALGRALEALDRSETVHREVLRQLLSLVYFPLWTIPAGGTSVRVTVLDGITGSVVARDADPAPLAREMSGETASVDRVLGFRPLCCPNCGWDLPVRPADVVFHCTQCERTWELAGEELEPIASDVLARATDRRGAPAASFAGASDGAGDVTHLPVWRVDGEATVEGATPRTPLAVPLLAPAFRWRALKNLCDLGARLTRSVAATQTVAPREAHELEPVKDMPLVGCSLDRTEALTMARLVAIETLLDDPNVRDAAIRRKVVPQVAIERAQTRLVWLPFAGDAYSLRDPLTGYALPRRSVEEMLG